MSLSATSLVGPALGTIPHLSPYLSAVCVNVAQSAQNAKILDDLENLTADVEEIENGIAKIEAQSALFKLYDEMQPTKISGWYEGVAKPWLKEQAQNPNKAPLSTQIGQPGAEINKECLDFLLLKINPAMQGTLEAAPGEKSGDWIEELITYYIAQTNENATPISILEKTYRSFLWMAQIQIKALLCLRAIGKEPKDLAKHTYQLIDNLIAQGKHCQDVINTTLENNENEFAWIQQSNVNPSSSRNVDSTSGIDFLTGNQSGTSPLAGVQFATNKNGATGVGLQYATSVLDRFGNLVNEYADWQPLIDDNATAAYGTSQICVPKIPAEYLIADSGQILCGAELLYNQTNGNSEFLCLGATVASLDDYGNLTNFESVEQKITASTIYKTDNHYIGTYQFTGAGAVVPLVDSPITGLYLSCAGNQIVIAVQTSIHQNAFKPHSVKSAPHVALKAMSKANYVIADAQNNTISMGDGPIGEKFYIGNVTGSTVKYGDFVTLIHDTSYLTVQLASNGGQYPNLVGGGGGGDASWWQLIDPNDVTNTGGEITNWNAVAIKNKQYTTYLNSESSGSMLKYASKSDMDNTRIINPDLVWNLSLRQ